MQLQLGSHVASLSLIGQSNNSQVFAELDRSGHRTGSALKLIMHNPDNSKGEPVAHMNECEHLRNEFAILKKVSHPNIIKLIEN